MPDIDGNVIAIDMDARALINLGMSRFGGLIRDHSGNFLKGFYGSMGFLKVDCYTHSLGVMKLVREANQDYHKLGNEIAPLRIMLQWN